MSDWLKSPPRKAPDAPPHVDLIAFNASAQRLTTQKLPVPPYVAYVQQHGPKLQMDEWGQALPLSYMEQFDLDRLVAVLQSPVERTRDLIVSGLLNHDEIVAVQKVNPDAYGALVNACVKDMIDSGPPFAMWAQSVLGILFMKPAATQYADSQQDDQGQGGNIAMGKPTEVPTQVDRREIAIRQQAGR